MFNANSIVDPKVPETCIHVVVADKDQQILHRRRAENKLRSQLRWRSLSAWRTSQFSRRNLQFHKPAPRAQLRSRTLSLQSPSDEASSSRRKVSTCTSNQSQRQETRSFPRIDVSRMTEIYRNRVGRLEPGPGTNWQTVKLHCRNEELGREYLVSRSLM